VDLPIALGHLNGACCYTNKSCKPQTGADTRLLSQRCEAELYCLCGFFEPLSPTSMVFILMQILLMPRFGRRLSLKMGYPFQPTALATLNFSTENIDKKLISFCFLKLFNG
jgi:hypothetical protein